MAKKRSRDTNGETTTAAYRHTGEKRTNIPPAKIAAEGTVPKVPKVRYHYSPHLPPVLRSDPTAVTDELPELIAESVRRPLTETEQRILADALRQHQPWLEWAGKREQHDRGYFDVDPVALHIHERISAQAVVRAVQREDVQRDLFADPQQPYTQAVQFYKHSVDWANRIILGDSLQVMASLGRREGLSGKVQMIYIDPPYGIKFGSNFQPQLGQRDVKERDLDLTREPEMVRAYRDTWVLGVHSYLSYLRDRFRLAHDLLAHSGSLFVQIGDEQVHRVRAVLDELFGSDNCCGLIAFSKTGLQASALLPSVCDFVLWYAKDKSRVRFRNLHTEKRAGDEGATGYTFVDNSSTGEWRSMTSAERSSPETLSGHLRVFDGTPLLSAGASAEGSKPFLFEGQLRTLPPNAHWKTNVSGLERLVRAGRVIAIGNRIEYKRYLDDYGCTPLSNVWLGLGERGFTGTKLYVVQTASTVIERCLLMTTDPGDLVFDPTCGSGTTAFVAEQWGRRWITCDTSRVALAIARQRLLTSRFPYYELRSLTPEDQHRNPLGSWLSDPTGHIAGKATLRCRTVPHITLKSIARNGALDPILERHTTILSELLRVLNEELMRVPTDVRRRLSAKLVEKQKRGGKRAVSEADRRRWVLPTQGWEEWEVPFDADPEWPVSLRDALDTYRSAWRAKMNDVNACISENAESEELVDQPAVAKGVLRVTGPFTVEGVRPEELSVGEHGVFDPTPTDVEQDDTRVGPEPQNVQAYLASMVQHLRSDGVSFMNNTVSRFVRLEALFNSDSASLLHAEGTWEGDGGERRVAVTLGPESGPVTALQVEEAIREARHYDDLVVAGFSFDAEATAVVAEQTHPKLRIHQAFIRPDLNSAMEGLLKDTPRSQLFTVFGQPEVAVKEGKDGWVVTLKGVDIYNPVENTVRSTGADKVAAWFLDSDFDGRCFCITQAFFPDQSAWDKIAKALGSSADPEAFEKFKGTTSLPFPKGKYGRIAVKVIDPRGNEVMAIRKLS